MGNMREVTRKASSPAVAKGAIAIFLPLLALMIGIAAIIYFVQTSSNRAVLGGKEKQTVELQRKNILSDLKSITSDLMFLARHHELVELFHEERSLDPKARSDINKKFLLFITTQKLYDQIRLLDENGMEIVRVNFNSGSPAVVPESELQEKKGRYYFDDTFRLGQGEVFVSPLDLNIENGEIEQPLKPMMRFGAPVLDGRGRKRGIVLVNYMGAYLLHRFGDIGLTESTRSMLLNSDGYYLKGPNPEDEWGFMYKDRKDRTFGKAYSTAWQRIESDQSGQFETGKGFFTFTTVYPLLGGQKSSSGSGEAYSSSRSIDTKKYKWKIVSHIPAEVLYAERRTLLHWILGVLTVLTIILGVGSWRLSWAQVVRHQSEEALRESEERYRNLVETSQDMIWECDSDGCFTYVNSAWERILGYKVDDMLGRPFTEFKPVEIVERASKVFENALKGSEIFGYETGYTAKSGEQKNLVFNIRKLEDANGNTIGTQGTAYDITERKQAEKEKEDLISELEAKNTELERFTYTASHDLKSPLITIKGFLGLLEKDVSEGNQVLMKADMKRISSAVEKMRRLLDELLELSRIGRMVNPPEEASFDDLVRDAVDMVQGRLGATGVKVDIASDLPMIYGDQMRLREVLENLLDNAVKFMGDKPDPRIEIGVKREADGASFYVRDNGIGIDPKYHEKVFGLFDKLGQSTEGTGVGLAIVKRIVEVHGGRIWVESEGIGKGTTFYFTLPDKSETMKKEG